MKSIRNIIFYVTLTIAIITNISNAKSEKNNDYEQYFKDQERIYEDSLKLKIPGARALHISESLAQTALKTCPEEVNSIISEIEQNIFRDNEKNIILQGVSGSGKLTIAQSIAIKSKTPCLSFYAGNISTEHASLSLQNLNKILDHAKNLEQSLKKPCIVILSELEKLYKNEYDKNNPENNAFINFWRELDRLINSKVIAIGTTNSTKNLPTQITDRTSIIKVPLPELSHRMTALSYHFLIEKNKHQLKYSNNIDSINLAQQTSGFSHRELQNLVIKATKPALTNNDTIVNNSDCINAIKKIKENPKRILEKEAGTWKHTFKRGCRAPKISASMLTSITALCISCYALANQREAMDQSKEIANKQMSAEQIAKQGIINLSVLGIPIGVPIYYIYQWTSHKEKDSTQK